MSKNTTSATAGTAIRTGGFFSRLVGYAFFYIPVTLLVLWLLVMKETFGANDFLAIIVAAGSVLSPFVLWERSIRKWRRANGFSVYKDITKELEQREIDERVKKEYEAYVNNGIVQDKAVDKSDIGYWHALLEKGAITKEEYEAKKRELLGV